MAQDDNVNKNSEDNVDEMKREVISRVFGTQDTPEAEHDNASRFPGRELTGMSDSQLQDALAEQGGLAAPLDTPEGISMLTRYKTARMKSAKQMELLSHYWDSQIARMKRQLEEEGKKAEAFLVAQTALFANTLNKRVQGMLADLAVESQVEKDDALYKAQQQMQRAMERQLASGMYPDIIEMGCQQIKNNYFKTVERITNNSLAQKYDIA